MKIPNKNKISQYFQYCSSKEEKFIYLIELGKLLPFKKKNIRIKNNIIYGCQSNVWIEIKKKKKIIKLNGDSDTLIIKGIIAIIISLYNKKKKEKIHKIDINNFFTKLHITNNISYSRIIGINSIISFIKEKI